MRMVEQWGLSTAQPNSPSLFICEFVPYLFCYLLYCFRYLLTYINEIMGKWYHNIYPFHHCFSTQKVSIAIGRPNPKASKTIHPNKHFYLLFHMYVCHKTTSKATQLLATNKGGWLLAQQLSVTKLSKQYGVQHSVTFY